MSVTRAEMDPKSGVQAGVVVVESPCSKTTRGCGLRLAFRRRDRLGGGLRVSTPLRKAVIERL